MLLCFAWIHLNLNLDITAIGVHNGRESFFIISTMGQEGNTLTLLSMKNLYIIFFLILQFVATTF